VRHFAIIAIAMFGTAGCHRAQPNFDYADTAAATVKQQPICDGEPYLEIQNRGNQAIDVYANVFNGSSNVYIGTVTPGTPRLSLQGTAAENHAASFNAKVGGSWLPTNTPGAPVTITRRCDKRG